MRSSQSSPGARRGRWVAILCALIGLGCVAYPLFSAKGRADGGAVFFPVVGLFMLAVAFVV